MRRNTFFNENDMAHLNNNVKYLYLYLNHPKICNEEGIDNPPGRRYSTDSSEI